MGAPHREVSSYEFLVAGTVSATVRSAFPELTVARGHGGTVFRGRVTDDGHLHDLLHRFQRLGLTILEMRVLPE